MEPNQRINGRKRRKKPRRTNLKPSHNPSIDSSCERTTGPQCTALSPHLHPSTPSHVVLHAVESTRRPELPYTRHSGGPARQSLGHDPVATGGWIPVCGAYTFFVSCNRSRGRCQGHGSFRVRDYVLSPSLLSREARCIVDVGVVGDRLGWCSGWWCR